MLGEGVPEEMAGECLNPDIGDVLGVPQKVLRNELVLHVEVDLSPGGGTSMRTRFSVRVLGGSGSSLKSSPMVTA